VKRGVADNAGLGAAAGIAQPKSISSLSGRKYDISVWCKSTTRRIDQSVQRWAASSVAP
jgi:hypothetical protein